MTNKSFRNGEGSGLIHFIGRIEEASKEKCKCGKGKFNYQKICGEGYLKELNKREKKNGRRKIKLWVFNANS